MKLVAIALVFCAGTFAQTAPTPPSLSSPLLDRLKPADTSELLKRRFDGMKLLTLPPLPDARKVVVTVRPAPRVCAIPLLQALPPNDRTDYKMQIYTPPSPPAQIASAESAVGMPACK